MRRNIPLRYYTYYYSIHRNNVSTRLDLQLNTKQTIGFILYALGCIIVAITLGELLKELY